MPMSASGRVARDSSECGGAPSRLSANRCRAPSRDSPSRPPETRLLARVDETPPRPPRRARYCRRDSVIVSGRMPARSKRSLAQLGKHGAKKLKVHHPDEAPAPATKRCRYARLAGASRRRRAAALGARPRALRAPARLLRERVRTLAVPTIVASGTLFSVAVCKSV